MPETQENQGSVIKNPDDYFETELEALRHYGPEMNQCSNCSNWHPIFARCPACEHDSSYDDD